MAKHKSRKTAPPPSLPPKVPTENFAGLLRIRIENLFGYFVHDVDLDQSGITILHGANGTGKSTILKILHIVSREDLSQLISIPFDRILLEFRDNLELDILKVKENGGLRLRVFLRQHGRPLRNHYIEETPKPPEALSAAQQESLDLALPPQARYVYEIQQYLRIMYERREYQEPEFIKELQKGFRAAFIQEQRLLKIAEDKEKQKVVFRRVVADYSAQLRTQIRDVLSQYAGVSQQLDRTFPQRVVEALEADVPPVTDVSAQILTLDEKRQQLHDAGLIDQEPATTFDIQKLKSNHVARVLSVHADDTRNKLAIFDNIFRKIQLFEKLVNSHFIRKEAHVSKDGGLALSTQHGKLDPSSLSSGEQHLLVLFYELIFGDVTPGQLVLIDEPELSLHPAWQIKFISDLEEIRELNNINFILATHSPQIIGHRWSFTRPLKFPDDSAGV